MFSQAGPTSPWYKRFKRKFQEQYLAIQLEKQVKDKNVILENYLNTINLGNGNYGVQAAAQGYFGKNVSDLTLSECTVIAGISQNPTKFNPVVYPEKNAQRRKDVLDHMLEQEYITKAQYDECLADNVYERIQNVEQTQEETDKTYSYFIDELTEQVVRDLQEQRGYTEAQAYTALYSGGLRIYTTQDPSIQQIVMKNMKILTISRQQPGNSGLCPYGETPQWGTGKLQ